MITPSPLPTPSASQEFTRRVPLLALMLALVAAEVRATVVVQIGQNFTGSQYLVDSPFVPPDCNGAAGPNHFVELINGRFSVYDKTTGSRLQTLTDFGFWNAAGLSFGAGIFISDPRLVYDPTIQRWIAASIDFNPNILSSNRFLLAISASSAPTGSWTGLAFVADPVTRQFADFPTLGVDGNGVYLGANMFNSAGNNIGVLLASIPKAGLLAPVPTITNRTSSGVMSLSSRGVVLQPAVSYEPPIGGEPVLSVLDLGYDSQPHSNLVSFAVLNAAGPGAATFTSSTNLLVAPYTIPLPPLQPDGTSNLDADDARIGATVYQVGYALYAVHCIEVSGRTAIRWYQINATNHALLQSGTITDPNLNLFYPSIAANTNGTVVIGCNGSSLSTFISCYAVVGETVNGVTTFGNLLLLKAGVASYHNPATGDSRWGDYSATSVDPSDPTRFWTIQMYPSASGTWATQITELRTSQLKLFASRSGTNVLISWTSAATGFQLQSTPALASTNIWSAVSQSPVTNSGQISVLVPLAGTKSFFRLQKL